MGFDIISVSGNPSDPGLLELPSIWSVLGSSEMCATIRVGLSVSAVREETVRFIATSTGQGNVKGWSVSLLPPRCGFWRVSDRSWGAISSAFKMWQEVDAMKHSGRSCEGNCVLGLVNIVIWVEMDFDEVSRSSLGELFDTL